MIQFRRCTRTRVLLTLDLLPCVSGLLGGLGDILDQHLERRQMLRERGGPHQAVGSAHVALAAHRRGALAAAEQIRNEKIAMRLWVPEPAVCVFVTHLAEFRRCKIRFVSRHTNSRVAGRSRSRVIPLRAASSVVPPAMMKFLCFSRLSSIARRIKRYRARRRARHSLVRARDAEFNNFEIPWKSVSY